MTVICLGPCCIPVSALFPVLLLFLAPLLNLLRKTPLGKYLPDQADAKKNKLKGKCNAVGTSPTTTCCSSGGSTSAGETESDAHEGVRSVFSIEEWKQLKQGPLVIADFTASWCKPCQKMAPIFQEIAAEHSGQALFVKVDIDDVPDAFDGMSVPAFHVLKTGEKVDGLSGAAEKQLRSMVAKHCKKTS